MISENKRRLNIKELVLPEPGKAQAGLDLDYRLSQKEWDDNIRMLIAFSTPSFAYNYAEIGSYMIILHPEKRDEITIGSDAEDRMFEYMHNTITSGDKPEFVKLLFPERFDQALHSDPRHSFDSMYDTISNWTISGYSDDYITRFIFRTYILHNDLFPDLSEITFLRGRMLERYNKHVQKNATDYIIEDVAMLRLLYGKEDQRLITPELASEVNFQLKNKPDYFHISDKVHLKIIMAEDIKMTDTGLVFTMPDKKQELENPKNIIPVRRRF